MEIMLALKKVIATKEKVNITVLAVGNTVSVTIGRFNKLVECSSVEGAEHLYNMITDFCEAKDLVVA